ncbi:MAG: hypothetical protein KAI79_08490 [Bacteroidales bacterium]|nr:hypothetical protein [Bacteroidales bacterium]
MKEERICPDCCNVSLLEPNEEIYPACELKRSGENKDKIIAAAIVTPIIWLVSWWEK